MAQRCGAGCAFVGQVGCAPGMVGQAAARKMVEQAKSEGFGHCTNVGECEAVCPKDIKLENIARMNFDFARGSLI